MNYSFCFPVYSVQTISYGPWAGNGYQEPGFLFDYWGNYPVQKAIFVAFCSVIGSIGLLTAVYFSVLISKTQKIHTEDYTPLFKSVLLPIITLVWQVFVGFGELGVVYLGVSITTIELILLHGLAELFMLGILLVLSTKETIDRKFTIRFIFWFLFGIFLLQALTASIGDVSTRAFTLVVALIPDVGSPIVLTYYLAKKRKDASIQLILLDILLFTHIVTFLIAGIICQFVDVVAIYMPVLMGFNLVVLIFYSLFLILRWNKEIPIPKLE